MNAKKIICGGIALALCFSAVACSSNGSKTENSETTAVTVTESTETVKPRIESNLPDDLDFGGVTITILTGQYEEPDPDSEDDAWSFHEMSVEELSGNPVDDAIYNRNLKVSDDLNIEIETTVSMDSISSAVRRDVSSGNGDYDIVCGSVCYESPLINDGLLYNLRANGIEDYIDLTKPWWPEKWVSQATMGDKLYSITGSLAITLKRLMFVVYYNKSLGESYNVENLYDVVRDGKWTIDKMLEISTGIYTDLNGNSIRDEEDSYGLLVNHYECADIYWSCFDLSLIEKDSDNWFVMANDEEKISKSVDICYDLTYNNSGTFDSGDTLGFVTMRKMFSAGQALLTISHLRAAESDDFRNMTDDYGILPEPKYDESQKEYYTYAHDQYTIFMIPTSVKNISASAATLEALGCESYNSVEVAYLDNTLKGRYSNDIDTRQMIDIIIDGFKVDPAFIYGMIFAYPTAKVFHDLIYNKSNSFATAYAKVARSLPSGLREMKETISEFDY